MVPKFPAEWFFTFEYWQREPLRAYRRCVVWVAASPPSSRGGWWMWKEVSRTTASRTWQENLFLGWSGCLGKSWSANAERCEDLKRLGPAGKKGWEVMGREGDNPSGKPNCPAHACVLLMLSACIPQSRCVSFPAYSLFPPWDCECAAEVLLQAQLSFRMCCLSWAPIPASSDNKKPQFYQLYHHQHWEQSSNGCLHWPNRISQGSSKPGALVRVNLGLLFSLPVLLELSVEVVPTFQWVCPVEVRSTVGGGRHGVKGWEPIADRPLGRAGFHVFISLFYLWHWWFPWPWDFAVKGKFESLPSFIYSYK